MELGTMSFRLLLLHSPLSQLSYFIGLVRHRLKHHTKKTNTSFKISNSELRHSVPMLLILLDLPSFDIWFCSEFMNGQLTRICKNPLSERAIGCCFLSAHLNFF